MRYFKLVTFSALIVTAITFYPPMENCYLTANTGKTHSKELLTDLNKQKLMIFFDNITK